MNFRIIIAEQRLVNDATRRDQMIQYRPRNADFEGGEATAKCGFDRYLPHRQWGTCKKVRNRVGLTELNLHSRRNWIQIRRLPVPPQPRNSHSILPTECTGQHRWFQPVFKGKLSYSQSPATGSRNLLASWGINHGRLIDEVTRKQRDS